MAHAKNFLSITLCLCLVLSCGDSASFETTHPVDGEVLDKIPASLKGRYLYDEEEVLVVKDLSIANIYSASKEDAYPLDSLMKDIQEEVLKIIERTDDNITVELDPKFIVDVKIKGDSAYLDFEIPDVIFSMNKGDILIERNRAYYFNVKKEEGDFQIRKVSFEGEDLLMENLVSSDSIRKLLNIPADSTLKNLEISAQQFELLNKVGFKAKKRYTKVDQ